MDKAMPGLDLNRLYLMDCMEGMAQFPDKHFPLAIVDPPYGIGMSDAKFCYGANKGMGKKDWDNAAPPPEYFKELFRVSRQQVIWGGAITSGCRRRGAL